MIPSAFVSLEKLPLTPTGKVDRKALPRPDCTRPDLAEPYLAARTPTEQFLAGIWAEVFKVERIGVHDNFFDLGGHSLLATMVIARINKRAPIAVSLRSLFQCPTIAALAKFIDERQGRPTSHQTLDNFLSELEALSEEEAERLLAAET
jgi:acyl carrier protein